jgi:hypothetical protein
MPREFTAAQGYTVGALAHVANDHLVSAMRLFEAGSSQLLDSGGYLAHLGIELLLKAGLLQVTGSFRDDHDLFAILDQLRGVLPGFRLGDAEMKTLRLVNDFYHLRYPHPTEMPRVGTLDMEAVKTLSLALRNALPPEVGKAIDEIDHTRKGGRILLWKPAPGAGVREPSTT